MILDRILTVALIRSRIPWNTRFARVSYYRGADVHGGRAKSKGGSGGSTVEMDPLGQSLEPVFHGLVVDQRAHPGSGGRPVPVLPCQDTVISEKRRHVVPLAPLEEMVTWP